MEPDILIVLLTWSIVTEKIRSISLFTHSPRRIYKFESTGVLPRLEVRGHAWRSRLSPPSFLGFLGPLFSNAWFYNTEPA